MRGRCFVTTCRKSFEMGGVAPGGSLFSRDYVQECPHCGALNAFDAAEIRYTKTPDLEEINDG